MNTPVMVSLKAILTVLPVSFNCYSKLMDRVDEPLSDDLVIPLEIVLDAYGFDNTIWSLRAVPEHAALWRLYAIECARSLEHLLKDSRSHNAIAVAERYALGLANNFELEEAYYSAVQVSDNNPEAAARCVAAAGYWAAPWYVSWYVKESKTGCDMEKLFRRYLRGEITVESARAAYERNLVN